MSKPKNKSALARALGIARGTLYYLSKKNTRDWSLKVRIEEVLREHPSYGSRRIAQHLELNRKGVQRVMRLYGIKPYRRRGRKYRKSKAKRQYPNLLLGIMPQYRSHIWAADFTEFRFHGAWVYVATVLDLWSREIVGCHVALRKGSVLTTQALYAALHHQSHPNIFHSDNGTDYDALSFRNILTDLSVLISRSAPGCPWENGYQESWYDKFKIDLGDPNRFSSLGELVAEIHHTIWQYNLTRIHSALRMPPARFIALQYEKTSRITV